MYISFSSVAKSLAIGATLTTTAFSPAYAEGAAFLGLSTSNTWVHAEHSFGIGLIGAYRLLSDDYYSLTATQFVADLGLNVEGHFVGHVNADLLFQLNLFLVIPYAGLSIGALMRSVEEVDFEITPTFGFILGGEVRPDRHFGGGFNVRYDATILDLKRTSGPLRVQAYVIAYF